MRAFCDALASDGRFAITHRDVVPRSLAGRLGGRRENTRWLVEPIGDRTVGFVFGDAGSDLDASTRAIASIGFGREALATLADGAAPTSNRGLLAHVELEDRTSGTTLRAFLDLLAIEPRPSPVRTPLTRSLPIELGIELARLALRVGELRTLGVGDVVVCEQGEAFGYRAVVDGASMELELEASDGALRLRRWMARETMEEMRMQTTENGLVRLDDARVEVALEAARLVVTLAELEALEVGSVLVAERALSHEVTLRVGGRPIARGRLVDVDGQLGVKVTELASVPTDQ